MHEIMNDLHIDISSSCFFFSFLYIDFSLPSSSILISRDSIAKMQLLGNANISLFLFKNILYVIIKKINVIFFRYPGYPQIYFLKILHSVIYKRNEMTIFTTFVMFWHLYKGNGNLLSQTFI